MLSWPPGRPGKPGASSAEVARRDIKLIIGTFVITAAGAFIGGIAASRYIVDLLRR